MQRKHLEIGTRFGKLTVIGNEESDRHGNQYVLVRCSCFEKTVKRMRATALTMGQYVDKNGKIRLPHRSCGCESKRAYREYWEKRAAGIRKRVRRQIWLAYQKAPQFAVVAIQFNLPAQLISAVVRLYNWNHDASQFSAIPRDSKARREWDEKRSAEIPF
jgi:hypothetical protein